MRSLFVVVFFTVGFLNTNFLQKHNTLSVCICYITSSDFFDFFAFYTLLIVFAVFKMRKEKREPNQTFKTSSNVRKLMPLGEERECTTSQS